MTFDQFLKLMDYGVGIAVSLAVLAAFTFIVVRILIPKMDVRLGSMEEEMKETREIIAANTAQITALTESVRALTEVCAKSFDDNRRTVQILLERNAH